MKITKINIFKNENEEEKVKGYVSIELENQLVIKNIKIINGENRRFVAMPSEKCSDGKYRDIVFPITKEFRKYIEEEIFKEFDK